MERLRQAAPRTMRQMLDDFRPIMGGDGTDVLTADGVRTLSTQTLEQKRDEVMARAKPLIDKFEGGADLDATERDVLRTARASYEVVKEELTLRSGDSEAIKAMAEARKADETARAQQRQERPNLYGSGEGAEGEDNPLLMTPGEQFLRSDSYQDWMKRYPEGAPSSGNVDSDQVIIPNYRNLLGMRTATEEMTGRSVTGRAPAIIQSANPTASGIIQPLNLGLIEPGLVRPLTIRQLVTTISVSTNAIEYVRELSREANAQAVAEATASGGVTGLKPEGGLVFQKVSTTVKTIAEWVAATRAVLADASQLRGYIDAYLTYDVALALENQMIAGNGGDGFTGILNTSGTQTVGPYGAGATALDNIRKAITLVQLNARTYPTAIGLHPSDSQNLDLIKDANGRYLGAGPFGGRPGGDAIWGLPRVVSEAFTAGTAVVADWSKAILFDRESTTVAVGTANDDFLRNIVRILAELRAGFGVIRPAAFVEVSLTAAP